MHFANAFGEILLTFAPILILCRYWHESQILSSIALSPLPVLISVIADPEKALLQILSIESGKRMLEFKFVQLQNAHSPMYFN